MDESAGTLSESEVRLLAGIVAMDFTTDLGDRVDAIVSIFTKHGCNATRQRIAETTDLCFQLLRMFHVLEVFPPTSSRPADNDITEQFLRDVLRVWSFTADEDAIDKAGQDLLDLYEL